MASVAEAEIKALYAKLAADSTLVTLLGGTAIYDRIAPPDTDLPLVIIQWQGGGDNNLCPKRDRSPVYTIKGLARTALLAGSLDARIDTLLHDSTVTLAGSGMTCYRIMRTDDVSYHEGTRAGPVYHTGGIYRIMSSE